MRKRLLCRLSIAMLTSILLLISTWLISGNAGQVYANNLTQKMKELSVKYGLLSSNDANGDGIINILDITTIAINMGEIDVSYILNSYVDIVKPKDKQDYLTSGFTFLSDRCLPVTSEGINLFAYVNAAEGMTLEIIEGDQTFSVENDRLYFTGQAPAIAKVKLKNFFSESKEFYVYGTNDRELHDFTYDYLLNMSRNKN